MEVVLSKTIETSLIRAPALVRKMLKTRIEQLRSVPMLGDMKYGRPHPLKGSWSGCVSFSLTHEIRLVCIPRFSGLDGTNLMRVSSVEALFWTVHYQKIGDSHKKGSKKVRTSAVLKKY